MSDRGKGGQTIYPLLKIHLSIAGRTFSSVGRTGGHNDLKGWIQGQLSSTGPGKKEKKGEIHRVVRGGFPSAANWFTRGKYLPMSRS